MLVNPSCRESYPAFLVPAFEAFELPTFSSSDLGTFAEECSVQ